MWGALWGAHSSGIYAHVRAVTYCYLLTYAAYMLGLSKLAPMTHHQSCGSGWLAGPAPTNREGIMPRKTKAQIALLLADLYAAKSDKRKADKRVDDLEAELAEIPSLKEGTYGEWTYHLGTPREIFDQPVARELLKAKGLTVPMRFTKAPVVVKPVAK